MGQVFRVRDLAQELKGGLALKQYRASDAGVERFRREVAAMQSVTAPNVMPVLECDLKAAPPWFVMPLAANSMLDRVAFYRTNHADLSADLVGALRGLEAIHKAGFVHRDIKPSNLLLLDNGGRPMVADLGLVRIPSSELTATDQVLGSPPYWAPELFDLGGATNATPTSDIFSFGKTIYHLASPT